MEETSLTAGTVAGTADFVAGGYLVRSELETSSCAAVSISVLVLDASGDVVGEGTRILGACGEHIVDFAFD